jgi:hypothetical protein
LIRSEVFGERLGFVAFDVLIQVGSGNIGQEIVGPSDIPAKPLMVGVKADRLEIRNRTYIIDVGKSGSRKKSPEAGSIRPGV